MKKFLAVFLVVVTVLTVSAIPVAAGPQNGGHSSSGSDFLYELRYAIVCSLVDVANSQIDALVERAIEQEDPDLDRLLARTEAISYSTIIIANALGITVICEYVPYEINGQIVYIDPLIVIRR